MSCRYGLFALSLIAPYALADLTAVTADGRQVTLHSKSELSRGCRLGLCPKNNLSAQILTLVLRFIAYKDERIAFETVSRGYSYIKPTNSQSQEISFRSIRCDEVRSVDMSAARNCHVGELTKYSASPQRCLEPIQVVPSKPLPIAKIEAK